MKIVKTTQISELAAKAAEKALEQRTSSIAPPIIAGIAFIYSKKD